MPKRSREDTQVGDKQYVVDRDGHLMSESEVEDATRLDEPVSTEGAPNTHAGVLAHITIERNEELIRTIERAISRDEAELATETDSWWRNYLTENLAGQRRRISELEAEIRAARGIGAE